MIINSITLKNFKSYEDKTTINLRPAANKNIVLIGGENGAGKSTLFEAIKVCIYGATAFGYVGQNYYYTEKIKGMICNNAYLSKNIETYVKLDISFEQGMEELNYTLVRKWNYSNHKLHETFAVYLGEKELHGEDFHYFEEYLKSELPPSMFDFFFFDGEELNSMFTGQNSSSGLKQAVLQLLNYNSFELLRKQLLHYSRENEKNSDALKAAQENYDLCSKELTEAKNNKISLEKAIQEYEIQLSDKIAEREKLENEFRRSGGILDEERNALTAEIASIENKRSEISMEIRDYCNDLLPFVLLQNELSELENQVHLETESNIYNSFKQKLSSTVITKAFHNTFSNQELSSDSAEQISKNIIEQLFDVNLHKDVEMILHLSKEQQQQIFTICNTVRRDKTNIPKKYEKYNNYSIRLKQLREQLNSSVSEELLENYLKDMALLNKDESRIRVSLENAKTRLHGIDSMLPIYEQNMRKAKNQMITLLQESNISNISDKITSFLDDLIATLTQSKVELIEQEFLSIFKQIIRKNNFIDALKLDKNFNSTLYIKKDYQPIDLYHAISNVGFTSLEQKYGSLFLEDLFAYAGETDEKKILEKLNNNLMSGMITIHTKVDIKSLSNGERQVFVLCLVWAILKVSNVNIPFIIDTPYARIDTTHRNGLSTLYLPNISKQVIILSTNEEIDHELYQTIKPYVCNEYLLVYDTEKRKTTVKNNYFEV